MWFPINPILGAIPEGFVGYQQLCGQAAQLFEDVYSRHPDHPGVLHYLIHAYDDPEHAQQGLKAARAMLGQPLRCRMTRT
jgi:hypothetical protein